MQRVETIPKRRPVITRGKVHCLRKDFQGRLGAGRRAEGKKKKFPRASALANRELEPETFKRAQLLHAATYWESCFKGRRGGANMGQSCSRKEMDDCAYDGLAYSQHARW